LAIFYIANFVNNFYICNSQTTKFAVLFLRYLQYNITPHILKSFDPPGIIIREPKQRNERKTKLLVSSSSSALRTWVGLGLLIKPN